MAIIGHWKSLEEANKLQQSVLLAGIVQEIYEQGEILPKFPVLGIDSISIEWNREKTLPSADYYSVGEPIPWTADVEYAEKTTFSLKSVVRQDVLDKMMAKNYRNPNDYKAVMLSQLRKGCMHTIEDGLIYNQPALYPKQFYGLHSLCQSSMAVDGGETALSLIKLRRMINSVKPKPNLLLMSTVLADRFDFAAKFGINSGSTNSWIQSGMIGTSNELGGQITTFDGIPIQRSDYMVAEQANTGVFAGNQRLKFANGTSQYSIIAVRFGQIEDGGVCLVLGADTGGPNFFDVIEFDNLEDYNAGGLRLVAYCGLAQGSTKSLAVMYDVTDAALTL